MRPRDIVTLQPIRKRRDYCNKLNTKQSAHQLISSGRKVFIVDIIRENYHNIQEY